MPLSKVKEKEFLSRPMGCKGVGFLILGAVAPKNFPLGGRTLLGDGIANRAKMPGGKKTSTQPNTQRVGGEFATFGRRVRLEDFYLCEHPISYLKRSAKA